jgi:hypothetical protein
MSTRTSLRYLEIFPNMALADVAKIDDLQRRALALFYSDVLDPANPVAIAVARSVDVPEAGAWGRNVKVRLAELERKKSIRTRSAIRQPQGCCGSGVTGAHSCCQPSNCQLFRCPSTYSGFSPPAC